MEAYISREKERKNACVQCKSRKGRAESEGLT